MGLLAKLNAFDPERDTFAGALTDKSEQTKLGAFMSVIVLPACVALYSALYFVQFYYGFGEGAPPLYVVTTSETIQYGNQAKELALECTNPYGCFFRIPQGGAQMCSSGSVGGEDPSQGNTDFCDTTSLPGGGGQNNPGPGSGQNNPGGPGQNNPGGPGSNATGRRLLSDLDATFPWQGSTSRHLLQDPPQEAHCADKVECGGVMDADDGVCAFVRPDPVDALTVAWRDDALYQSGSTCQGPCNFGVSLITDYLDEADGKVKQKKIKVHRGIVLLSLVERHDVRMQWDSSHPDHSSKKGKTVIYEWGITPVDVVGTVESSNLCVNDLVSEFNNPTSSDEVANAKSVKLTPFPLYTKVTTSYPSPVMAYLAAVGGIAATLGGMFGVVHTLHLEYTKRSGDKSEPAEKAPVENAA